MSGPWSDHRLGNGESLGPLIEKPFTVDDLLETMSGVCDG